MRYVVSRERLYLVVSATESHTRSSVRRTKLTSKRTWAPLDQTISFGGKPLGTETPQQGIPARSHHLSLLELQEEQQLRVNSFTR